MILGLDISTSITGYCVLDMNGEIIKAGAWDTRNKNKFKSEFEKIEYIKENLCELLIQFPIGKVYIEKPFMFFGSGKSTAKTMATLQRYNGMVSWIAYELFEQKPEYFTAQTARKNAGLSIPRKANTKKEIIKWFLDKYPSYVIEYTSYGNPKPKYYDIADAVVIALAGLNDINEKKDKNNK